MELNYNTGLVLEGGGMRGVFTSGVLDYLLDRKIYFPYVVAVSAGACNAVSYMSRQRGRSKRSNIDYLKEHNYIGFRYLLSQHSILDQELLYNKMPNELLPFDYEMYSRNPATYEMVTVNCRTGKPCYLREKKDRKRMLDIVKASSSLPFVCPIVEIDSEPMLDGGIIDSIPFQRAIETGHPFNIVVSTRNYGFRIVGKDRKVPKLIYNKYPRLRLALSNRHAYYNAQLEQMEQLETEGRIFVIRPFRPMEIDRLETDIEKLTALYEEGYAAAERALRGIYVNFTPKTSDLV
ncbi:MAG: patatin family protein [Bacteroidaceae bacterium]